MTRPLVCPCADVSPALLERLAERTDIALVPSERRAQVLAGEGTFTGIVLAAEARTLLALETPLRREAHARGRWVLLTEVPSVELPRLGACLRITDVVRVTTVQDTIEQIVAHATRQLARVQGRLRPRPTTAPFVLGGENPGFRASVEQHVSWFAGQLSGAIGDTLALAPAAVASAMGAEHRGALQHLTAALHQIHHVCVAGADLPPTRVPQSTRDTENS